MLDFVQWYLIELKRELRGHIRTSEWLAESRSHLEDHVAELVALGTERQEAMKQAVVSFGDPASIAWSLRNGTSTTRRGAWIAAAIVGVLFCLYWVPPTIYSFGRMSYGMSQFAPLYLTGPILGVLILFGAVLRTRRWVALPAIGVVAVISLMVSVFSATVGSPVHVPGQGQTTQVAVAAIPEQIHLRKDWLTRSEKELPEIRSVVAGIKQGGAAKEAALNKVMNDWSNLAPGPYLEYPVIQPSDALRPRNWIRLGPTTFGHIGLVHTMPREAVDLAWQSWGDGLIRTMEQRQVNMRLEIETLSLAPSTPFLQRLVFVGQAGVFVVTSTALITLFFNGLFLGVIHGRRRLRWAIRQRGLA